MKRKMIIQLEGSSETINKLERIFTQSAVGMAGEGGLSGLSGYVITKENIAEKGEILIPDFIKKKHGLSKEAV